MLGLRHLATVGLCIAVIACSETGTTSTMGSSGAVTVGESGSVGTEDASTTDDDVTGTSTGCEPTEASVREAIIVPSCATAGCHDAAAAGGLDLTVADLTGALADVASGTCDGEVLVLPGDPENSFLYTKLLDQPACGEPMPIGQSLTTEEIECVAGWISQANSTCETCGEPTCVDVQSSAQHCGACDSPCPDGVACVEGECACPAGTVLCGGECVDTQSDPSHCGGCDLACGGGLFCLAGDCVDDCGSLSECGGACVDVTANPLHCGGCDSPCDEAEACLDGQCGCDAPATSYADDVEPFIVAECATNGCHRPMGPNPGSEGLNLASGSGYDAIVGVSATQCDGRPLIDPGSPGNSYLYDKIRGVNLCQGTKMPKMGPGLSAAQLQTVSDWICSGAAP